MAVKIVLTNQKGGVGKTTTTGALIAGLCRRNKKVLSVDLDPQGNLGFSLGVNIQEGHTIYEVLAGEVSVKEAVKKSDGYGDILTSDILLSQSELLFEKDNRLLLLKNALKPVEHEYDFIIIDTPPALSILTVNGYVAADHLIIPMTAEILSLVGLIQLKETVEGIQESLNVNLNVLGILLTRFNRNTNLSKDVKEMANSVAEQIDTKLFEAKIRSGVAVGEAPAHGQSVVDYSPNCNVSRDYKKFVDEVIERVSV